jgi:hypothetical protein
MAGSAVGCKSAAGIKALSTRGDLWQRFSRAGSCSSGAARVAVDDLAAGAKHRGGRSMTSVRIRALVLAGVLPFLPAAASAQVVGSIIGNVLDQSGTPLAGVQLIVSSGTQIGGEKVSYSNAEGFFRFPGLQPGTFELRARAPKLKTVVQRDIRVGVNAPAEVVVMMEVESATEEVKVVESAPIVSTTTANVREVFDADFVDQLPLDKRTGYGGFIRDNVPGAANGGDWSARVRGGNLNQNAFMLEGFVMTGQKITLNSLAAMEVQTAGYGAENAGAPGMVVNMVTQSGSNQYALDVTSWMEDSRLAPLREASDGSEVDRTYFVNPALSGPIIKDKLWFYLNTEVRRRLAERAQDPTGFGPESADLGYSNRRGTLKLTWQATPRNKIQSFTLVNREGWENLRDGFDVTSEAQQMRDYLDYFTGLTWESLISDSLFFKTQLGLQGFRRRDLPEACREAPETCQHTIPVEQLFPRRTYLENYDRITQLVDSSLELVNTLEWFGRTSWADHSVKAVSRYFGRYYQTADGVPGDAKEIFNGVVPDRRIDYYSNDPRLDEARRGYWLRTSSGFRFVNSVSDAMRVTRFLTVTPGVALTSNRASTSLAGTVISQTVLTPHLAVAWDPLHDSRTVVRASFNQYVDTDAVRVARHALGDGVSRECRYNATTGEYDVDCRYSGGLPGRTIGLPCGPQGYRADGTPCREKLKTPRTTELTAGAEREVSPGLGLGADFIYRSFRNPYERRETNRIWNDGGTALAPTGAYRNGRAETIDDLGTPANARRRYLAVTASLKKREGRLKMTGSYTWSRLQGNVPNEEDNEWGNIPPRDIFLWGNLPNDRRHELRASVAFQATGWLSTGMLYTYYSGGPYSRRYYNPVTGRNDNYRARIGVNPGTDINDPGDDRELRLPDQQAFNLQVRANLQPLIGHRLELYGDILNVLALRTTTAVYTDDGPFFGQPSDRRDTMRIRLGLRFRY